MARDEDKTQIDSFARRLPNIPVPEQVIKDYRIVRQLGEGGMGLVFLVVHTGKGAQYAAMKMLSPWMADQEEFVTRFHHEASVLGRLDGHPNVVKITDGFDDQGRCFLVMEYVDGGSLDKEIRDRGGEPIPMSKLATWLRQLLLGLGHAHSHGIIHRDLKPANLLLTKPSGFQSSDLKIADFGLAEVVGPDFERTIIEGKTGASPHGEQPAPDSPVREGTLDYMAPEVRAGKPADERADIYAFGVIAYYLSTGRKPLGAFKLPSKLSPELSKSWDRFVLRCLEPEPKRRFQSVNEVLTAFDRLHSRRLPVKPLAAVLAGAGLALILFLVVRMQPDPLPSPSPDAPAIGSKAPLETNAVAETAATTRHRLRLTNLHEGANVVSAFQHVRVSGTGEANLELPPGQHRIEISAEGFQSRSIDVKIGSADLEEKIVLERSPAAPLSLTGLPKGARVSADDGTATVATTAAPDSGAARVNVRPGPVTFRIEAERYHPLVQTVKIAPGQDSLSLSLTPKEGYVLPLQLPPGVTPIELRLVKPGTFPAESPTGGGSARKARTTRPIVIEREFYLGTYELLADQFHAIRGEPIDSRRPGDRLLPARHLAWGDVEAFIVKLQQLLDKKNLPFEASIPTEKEWEYACRANGEGDYDNGQRDIIYDTAFPPSPPESDKAPEDRRRSNRWSFADMLGNVAEWTSEDETGAPVLRGGHYKATRGEVKASSRMRLTKTSSADGTMGFRVLLYPTN